ncbi:MAG: histidine kinase [Caulobacteraceae bacterium]|jgi:DNA-binding response OmpR family regulator|nr:histidine kinase [Caulobacteraceae bacterium]
MSKEESPLVGDEQPGPARRAILVVEDEALVRMLVVQTLEEAGYDVHEAAEARAAMTVLQSDGVIDLMVTDLGLPGVNGKQLAEQARGHKPELKILFMTGYADSTLVDGALPAGIDLITKPFDLDDLAAKAGALLAL